MLVLHLSDLHLSRYGENGTWKQCAQDENGRWQVLHSWQRWQIEGCRDRKDRPDKLRLVDPAGLIHKEKGWPPKRDDKVISLLLALAMKRHITSSEKLIKERPAREDLELMLKADPRNTNLRFLKVVEQALALGPDVILLTGDVTDHGFGYGLVLHYLSPWIEGGRLFAVPGNHDTYDMIPGLARRARAAVKEDLYQAFAARLGLESNSSGAYVRRVGDVAVVGLNSCRMPLTPLSASGAVSREQLVWLRELGRDAAFADARLRIALVHHHLLRMPFLVGKRNPIEVAMRLRNAVETMQTCTEAGLDIVFNGHRHHGYVVKLPGRPMVISSPSSTLGCKSTGSAYAWHLDLDDAQPFPRMLELASALPGS